VPDDIRVLAATGDDTTAPPVATDYINLKHYQKIKAGWGADNTWVETTDVDGQRIPVGGGQLGAINEAAPGSDIANSGLNGRLQRIAQRITSLIALFPASLGTKTAAASLAVTLASDQPAVPTSIARRETALTLTVASGSNLSGVVDTTGYGNVGIIVPATFDGASITFRVCDTSGGTFVPLYDITGQPVTVPLAPSRASDLPGELMVWRFWRIETTTLQATTDTVFTLVLRS
jgi:hypothetical protein